MSKTDNTKVVWMYDAKKYEHDTENPKKTVPVKVIESLVSQAAYRILKGSLINFTCYSYESGYKND